MTNEAQLEANKELVRRMNKAWSNAHVALSADAELFFRLLRTTFG